MLQLQAVVVIVSIFIIIMIIIIISLTQMKCPFLIWTTKRLTIIVKVSNPIMVLGEIKLVI